MANRIGEITLSAIERSKTAESLLSQQQKNVVRTLYVFSLALSLTGLGLSAVSVALYSSDVKDSSTVINNLRFPCMVFGASLLYCSGFIDEYFTGMRLLQRGLPFVI